MFCRGGRASVTAAVLLAALALPLHPLSMVAATAGALNDVAIMLQLRQSLLEADRPWTARWYGWGSTAATGAHPCTWQHVKCSPGKHIISLRLWDDPGDRHPRAGAEASTTGGGAGDGDAPGWVGPLLPQLAQLQWLEHLSILWYQRPRLLRGMPHEWGMPGAFPRLTRMSLSRLSLLSPLPDIHPGALPHLAVMYLEFDSLPDAAVLPAGWGSRPDVLPALQQLNIIMPRIEQLPAAWAAGFKQLETLYLTEEGHLLGRPGTPAHPPDTTGPAESAAEAAMTLAPPTALRLHAGPGAGGGSSTNQRQLPPSAPAPLPSPLQQGAPAAMRAAPDAAAAAAAVPAYPSLPAEWAASGSFPKLQYLGLALNHIAGSLPDAWTDGGFPAMIDLGLEVSLLTGTLPPQLFQRHPKLRHLALEASQVTGPLPEAWGQSLARELQLAGNALTGPAFPPAWLQQGAMQGLEFFRAANNPGINGTLPANLSWPNIRIMDLHQTGLRGSISESWCRAPFANVLALLLVDGTAVDGLPPRCASRDLPQFKLGLPAEAKGMMPLVGAPPGGWGRQQQLAMVVVLSTLLPVAAVAAGGAVGRMLWLRRLRGRRGGGDGLGGSGGGTWVDRQQQRRDLQSLLRQQQRRDSAAAGGGGTGGGGDDDDDDGGGGGGETAGSAGPLPVRLGATAGRSKRARLTALLNCRLGSGRRRAIEMLPLEALPAALTHQLGACHGPLPALPPGWGGGSGGGRGRGGCGSPVGSSARSSLKALPPGIVSAKAEAHQQQAAAAAAAVAAAIPADGPPLLLSGGTAAGPGLYSSSGSGSRSCSEQCLPSSRGGSGSGSGSGLLSAEADAPSTSMTWHQVAAADSLRMSPNELEFSMDGGGMVVELGGGSQGVVYLAKLHGMEVAVKVIELGAGVDSQLMWRQVSRLRPCVHEHIVPLYGVAVEGQLLMVAMQLMLGGSLLAALQGQAAAGRRQEMRWEARGRQVAVDVAEALEHVHSLQITHGDLKASNVLLYPDCRACLADVGLSQVLACGGGSQPGPGPSSSSSSSSSSQAYRAPEQAVGEQYTLAADMYSFGVLLLELTTQQLVQQQGGWRLPPAPQDCPQGVLDLILDCLSPDPARRPTAIQALRRLRASRAD